MEKESLINSLKERIGENDFNAISRRSVETIIEPLLPMFADDEKVTDETYALPVALLKSFIGQSRHDIAEGIKSEKARLEADRQKTIDAAIEAAKLEWSKKNAQNDDPKADPKPASQEPADINAIIERKFEALMSKDGALGKLTEGFNTFINDYNKRRTEETEASLRQRIAKGLEDMGADKGKVIELALRDLKFDSEKSYDDLFKEAKDGYEALYKELYANGPMPFAGGSGEKDSDAGFQAYLKRKQEQADRQEKDAEALRTKMM